MLERILIVGMGSIGKRHARIARELIPEVQLAAWRHLPDASLPPEVDLVVTSVDDAIAFAPQLAVIASPAGVHLDAALPLAKAGVNLLVEKPISTSAVGVAQLIETCELRGVALVVGYNLRFMPSLLYLRGLLHAGRIGRITSVRSEVGQHLASWRPGVDYRDSVSAKSGLGGGVLLELSHEIDYLRWLFGEVRWVSAITLRQSSLEIDVEDTAHIVIGFTGRAGAPPIVASLNMDFVRHDSTRRCEVLGEDGTLRWNGVTGTVELFARGASEWSTMFAQLPKRDETYVAEWLHAIACVEGAAEPAVSGADGLAVVKVIDAVRRSASQARVVSLDGDVPLADPAHQ
jgi:predicted dehydrogenase